MSTEPLDCARAFDLLQDFLKQELTPALAVRMEEHLRRCRPCFGMAVFERRFIALLSRSSGTRRCPDALRRRVEAALRTDATPPPDQPTP